MALAIALVLLALVETVSALTAPYRVASNADWEAAAAEVRAGFRSGDLIVFAPAWSDQVGRAHLGDLVTVEMAGRADADRYGRVWQVSIRGARAPETAQATLLRTERHGRVTVALYQKPSVTVLYDFTSHAADARVTELSRHSDERPCYKQRTGFRCAGVTVEPRTLEVGYAPHRGILTPADGDRLTRLEFSNVLLGRTLVGYTGLHDFYSRLKGDGPVDFAVFIDGQKRFALHYEQAMGWRRFTVDTTPLAGTRHTVRFEVSSPRPAWRTFGFHAEARK
ncbi:MAG: hypothetical protein ACHQ17_00645 [Polyangia bacterium]